MLVCFIAIEPCEQSAKVGSRNLAILLRKGNHFVSAKFNGTAFVGCDMRCFSCYHTLIGLKHGVNHCGIRLGATTEEKHLCVGTLAGFTDALFSGIAIDIESVSVGL